jgi:lactate dehydrogenase-like 2-hydroxyacid dehydrogenase
MSTVFASKPGLLFLDRFMDTTEARLAESFDLHRGFDPGFRLDSVASQIVAIATSGGKGAPREVIAALPELRVVAIRGVGTDAVDLDLAERRGIRVTTTPGLLTEDVADLAVALLLACARRIGEADRFVRAGKWHSGIALPLARRVTGMRIGIVGMGRIGRAIAVRLAAFGATIRYTSLRPCSDVAFDFVPEIHVLAGLSDALVLAASGGPRSFGIVDESVLVALGPSGILVNVARGSLVDETALVAALVDGRLGSAGLDVFMDEPNVPAALWSLENVILQPHRASATLETRQAMESMLVETLLADFAAGLRIESDKTEFGAISA